MIKFYCNSKQYRHRFFLIILLMIISLLISILVYAETSVGPARKENTGDSPIKAEIEDFSQKEKTGKTIDRNPTAEVKSPGVASEDGIPIADLTTPNRKPAEKPVEKESPKVGVATANAPVSERITMESDKAVINRADHIIELEGNVKITQSETVITSNMIKLFLKEGATLEASKKTGESAIERIIATGNVIFKLGIGVAYSDQAVYTTSTKLLVLTGKEPKFISGNNTITGSKITVNRETGMVTIEGNGKSRVEAVIYSKEQL